MSSPTARAGVEVQYRATGVEAIKRGNMELMRSSDQMKQRIGSASQQIASGIENIARQGKLTGEAMKQVAAQGAQIAFMFGPQGAIAGAVAVLGVAMFSFWDRTRREMEETRKKGLQEMEALLQGGDLLSASRRQQFARSGNPNALRQDGETPIEFLRRSQGIMGLEALQQRTEGQLARATGARYAGRRDRLEDRLEAINEQLRIARAEYEMVTPVVDRLTEAEGRRAANLQRIDAAQRAAKGLPGAANLPGLSTALASTPGTFASGIGAFAGSNVTLRAGGATNAADLIASNEMEQQIIAGAQRLAEVAQVNIGQIVGEGLANGFAQAFSGEGVSGIIKGFGATVLSSIGSLFQQMGAAYLQFGQIMSWATALYNPATAGAAGLALGVALMALGGALQGLASGGRGGGGGIGAAVTATSTTIDRGLINPLNPLATSVSPRQSNVFHVGVINPHDPATQRVVQQTIRNAGNMGGV